MPVIANVSSPVSPSDRASTPAGIRSGRIAHADQVRAVDALERFGDHRAHAEQHRPLRGPVARGTRTVLLAGQHDQRRASAACTAPTHRRSTSARRSAGSACTPPSTPGTSALRRRTLANVPRTITSWLPRRAPYELKSSGSTPCSIRYFAAGDWLRDVAGRRDVVGRDRIAEHGQRARAADIGQRRRLRRHAVEVRRPLDVFALRIPRVALAGRDGHRRPALVADETRRRSARGTSRR